MLVYILSRNENLYSTKRLFEEALNKGWEVRVIDYLKCTIEIMKNELVVNYEGEILKVPDAVAFITQLGYPVYFIPFIGVAKVLGSIAIVVPRFPKLKEWAYAGLTFDLIGAVYSNLMVNGWDNGMLLARSAHGHYG